MHSVGNIAPACNSAPSAQAEATAVFEATTIKVTRHSLDIFLLMFPKKDGVVKEVLWGRFVYAMVDAGFTARNNSRSLVSFKKLDGEGRVIFYKPHPVPKIDPAILRAIGKRMAKWFGWSRELFVLCEDTT